jgi:acid phosphatase (class A)
MLFFRLIVVLAFLLCGAVPANLQAATFESHYVTSAELPPRLLPPPPVEGSDAWKKNMREVLTAQKHISPDDRIAIRNEQHLRIDLVTDVMGPDFTRERLPKTFALLDRVFEDSEAIAGADKAYWHTQRPYLRDKHVKLLVDRIDQSPSYPSGHTSGSRVLAEVLGMICPDRRDDVRLRAESIAYHRVQAGVHYPVDLEGGRLLAMLIVGGLIKSDDFQTDLHAARDEIAVAR